LKLNKGKEVDIYLKVPQKLNLDQGSNIDTKIYSLKNNTNKTFIIDPLGFYGTSTVYSENSLLKPVTFLAGHYDRVNDSQCRRDLIILYPRDKIMVSLNLDSRNRGIYNFSENSSYTRVIKSFHNRYYASLNGCDEYIAGLEKKGDHVLEDSIIAKIHYAK